jgi:sec-independent protein translocase protein TatB
MAAEFQGQFREAMHEAELDQLKKDVEKATGFDGLDPFADVKKEIDKTQVEIETSLNTPATATTEHSFSQSIEPAPHPQAEAPHLPDPVRVQEVAQAPAPEAAPARSGAPS